MTFHVLRLLTRVGLVRQNVLILSEVSLYVERSKNLEKKYVITVQKEFTFLRGFDLKNKDFWNIEKSYRQVCFQMTLNARKLYADSFLKVKTNDNRARLSLVLLSAPSVLAG